MVKEEVVERLPGVVASEPGVYVAQSSTKRTLLDAMAALSRLRHPLDSTRLRVLVVDLMGIVLPFQLRCLESALDVKVVVPDVLASSPSILLLDGSFDVVLFHAFDLVWDIKAGRVGENLSLILQEESTPALPSSSSSSYSFPYSYSSPPSSSPVLLFLRVLPALRHFAPCRQHAERVIEIITH